MKKDADEENTGHCALSAVMWGQLPIKTRAMGLLPARRQKLHHCEDSRRQRFYFFVPPLRMAGKAAPLNPGFLGERRSNTQPLLTVIQQGGVEIPGGLPIEGHILSGGLQRSLFTVFHFAKPGSFF